MKMRSGLLAAASMAMLISTPAFAESPPTRHQPNPDSPIGVRNASAPAELKELEFLIGDWRVELIVHRPEGDVKYEARWHNTWIINGYAIMQEWRDAYSTGAELRTWNSQKRRWEGRNFYTGYDTWTESTGAFANGEFVIETETNGPQGPRLGRERYYEIRPDSFRMVAVRSEDGGKTWSTPAYEMICTRIP
jgi:hypothetical protein